MNRRMAILAGCTGLALVLGGVIVYQRQVEARRLNALRENVAEIKIALDYFQMHEERLPSEADELLSKDYMTGWPKNPFAEGPMVPQKLFDPAKPGGFVFVPLHEKMPRGEEMWVLVGYAGSKRNYPYDDQFEGIDWPWVAIRTESWI